MMAALQTRFTKMFEIEHPIALAPMGGAVDPELAAAVNNAGGFAILPSSWGDPDTIRAWLKAMHSATDKPFAANLRVDENVAERLDLCLENGVRAIHFFWGDATPFVDRVHSAGARTIQTVSDSEQAKRACGAGVDVLIAQGWEAGGHVRGTVASLPLIPSVVDVAGDTPVLAAGGIADGRGLAAAMCLGASGVVMGTRFLASTESCAHPDYASQILSAREHETVYADNLFNLGWENAPHRALRSALAARWFEDDCPDNAARHRAAEIVAYSGDAEILAYQSATPHKSTTGDISAMSMWAGQGCGLVNEKATASQIINDTVSGAASIMAQQASYIVREV